MPLQTLIRKEAELTLLAIQRWTIVDHLGMDLQTKTKFQVSQTSNVTEN